MRGCGTPPAPHGCAVWDPRDARGAARNGTPVPRRKMGPATGTTSAEKSVLARAVEQGATAVEDEKGAVATRVGTGTGSRDATETRGAAKKEFSTAGEGRQRLRTRRAWGTQGLARAWVHEAAGTRRAAKKEGSAVKAALFDSRQGTRVARNKRVRGPQTLGWTRIHEEA